MEKNPVLPDQINGINSGQASFEFKGHFQNHPVLWQCTLQTLQYYYQSLVSAQQLSSTDTIMLKKFIDVQNDTVKPRIEIGLDVDCIDEPTIRKAIIMVQNYKNLHPGRHEYGTAYRFPRN